MYINIGIYMNICIIIIIIILFRHRLNIIYINNSVYSLHRNYCN